MPSSTSSSDLPLPGLPLYRRTRASAERATAADRPAMAQPVPERPVPDQPWVAIVGMALLLCVLMVAGWESYWRTQGAVASYRDDPALWAIQWRRVLQEPDATVLTGASRTLFDTQLPVWERRSGRRPIQLALNGTSPTFVMEQLADEPSFHGRVLIGIAPDIFFTGFEYLKETKTYWRKESPSQRVGKWLSMHLVEPWLAFYDPDFALFPVFRRQAWPERPGAPNRLMVRKLTITGADRATYMWPRAEVDPQYAALARKIWTQNFDAPSAEELVELRKEQAEAVKRMGAAVSKLRERGVPVLFVREPSDGDYLAYEDKWFPRKDAWDVLLQQTGSRGVYFDDYATLRDGYVLPEWSHLSHSSAERYTEQLYNIIDREFAPDDGSRW